MSLTLLLSALLPVFFAAADMRLEFTNVQHPYGRLYVAVFDRKEDFLQPDRIRFKEIAPVRQSGRVEVLIPDVPAGTYAVSCFHDLNNNGQLDKNWLGIPTEPYCFSNNARPRFRAPGWEEARFEFIPGQTIASLRLEKW